MLTFGSLFSGIGGLDLGLERAGMACRWQVEIDDYAQRVLAKHWPDVPRFRDVREVGGHNLEPVQLICGGFPCQDISAAGKRAGIDGERSGLWTEFARVVREIRPRFVLVENVAALLARGVGRVLGDLATGGYDAEWDCLPAAAVGAPHLRDRLFLVAHADGELGTERVRIFPKPDRSGSLQPTSHRALRSAWMDAEPRVDRMAHGVPSRVDRLRCLGNAVVPQVAEWIGRRIVEAAR